STLGFMPKSETAVMVITVIGTVATNNLAIGVILGVVTAMVMFAQRVSRFTTVTRTLTGDGEHALARSTVAGALFPASSAQLSTTFHSAPDPHPVLLGSSDPPPSDGATIAATDAVTLQYSHYGEAVDTRGLKAVSRAMRAGMTG